MVKLHWCHGLYIFGKKAGVNELTSHINALWLQGQKLSGYSFFLCFKWLRARANFGFTLMFDAVCFLSIYRFFIAFRSTIVTYGWSKTFLRKLSVTCAFALRLPDLFAQVTNLSFISFR